jgi:hypothetical protein
VSGEEGAAAGCAKKGRDAGQRVLSGRIVRGICRAHRRRRLVQRFARSHAYRRHGARTGNPVAIFDSPLFGRREYRNSQSPTPEPWQVPTWGHFHACHRSIAKSSCLPSTTLEVKHYRRKNSGSFAILAAIRRASSLVMRLDYWPPLPTSKAREQSSSASCGYSVQIQA